MRVDRTDTVQNTIYIMTETHPYREVLTQIQKIEPRSIPIKHVGSIDSSRLATGYKVPAATSKLDEIKKLLDNTETQAGI